MKKYECHITLSTADGNIAAVIARQLHWKTSEIARDPVLGEDTYYYLTSHHVDYDAMKDRMDMCVMLLRASGVNIIREKIELIVHDTKIGLEGPRGSIVREGDRLLVADPA
jgi:hypothetical protein